MLKYLVAHISQRTLPQRKLTDNMGLVLTRHTEQSLVILRIDGQGQVQEEMRIKFGKMTPGKAIVIVEGKMQDMLVLREEVYEQHKENPEQSLSEIGRKRTREVKMSDFQTAYTPLPAQIQDERILPPPGLTREELQHFDGTGAEVAIELEQSLSQQVCPDCGQPDCRRASDCLLSVETRLVCPDCKQPTDGSIHSRKDGTQCLTVQGRRGWRTLGEYDG